MKVRLINSAMMPKEGDYQYRKISSPLFFEAVLDAHRRGVLVHNIGYQQNIDIINQKTGLNLKPNRDATEILSGDEILTMSLSYRVEGLKGKEVDEHSFDYGFVKYKEKELTIEQQRFLDNWEKGNINYNFANDETNFENEDQTWKNDIELLHKIAIKVLGKGYQKKIAKQIGVKPQSIQRVFALKFSPTYKLLYQIIHSVNHKTFFMQKDRRKL